MPSKKNSSPVALIERAVAVACANARLPGWRQAQMKVFANRYGEYPIPEQGVDLETECTRIVRSAGYRYARKLLNWFIAVKKSTDAETTEIGFPIGIPKQVVSGVQKAVVPVPVPQLSHRLYQTSTRPHRDAVQQQLM